MDYTKRRRTMDDLLQLTLGRSRDVWLIQLPFVLVILLLMILIGSRCACSTEADQSVQTRHSPVGCP